MKPIHSLSVVVALALTAATSHAQEAPVGDITADGLIQALTPRPQRVLRGVTPVLREEDMPSIDLSVEFEFGSFELTQDAQTLLTSLGQAIASDALEPYRFRLSGHTDAVGSEEFNQELSMARAEAVREFLVAETGVPTERLETAGLGETQLLFVETPDDPRNRRVEVRVLPE